MGNKNIKFTLTPEVKVLGVKCAVFSIDGLVNKTTHPEFELYKNTLFTKLKQEYSKSDLSKDPILQGFEELHKSAGCLDSKLVPSPQSLISLLLKNGSLPQINLLVDIYNCISISSRLSLGAHDAEQLGNKISLCIAKGTETFIPLGKNKLEKINSGEYCYMQDDNVICRLECRQADATKITLDTKDVLFIIQGNENTTPSYLEKVMQDLYSSVTNYCGGAVKTIKSALE